MKLSEAILLGSTIVTPKAGALSFSSENAGCALGMAVIARGCTFVPAQRQIPVKDLRTMNVEDIWGPWLVRVAMRPCDCRVPVTLGRLRLKEVVAALFDRGSTALPREMRVKDIVAHLFDYHVMEKRDWTLDQLVAWLERFEPLEPPQNAFVTHSLSGPHSNDHSEDAAEWQKTREAFEAKVNAKRRHARSA